MKFSKLKQRIEECFADSVKGRVELRSTRYRHSHDQEGEAWITIDTVRVYSAGSITYFGEHHKRTELLCQKRDSAGFSDRENAQNLFANGLIGDEVERQLRNEGFMTLPHFHRTLLEYLNTSIEQIMQAEQPVMRALGVLDRRVGKRRLKLLDVSDEHCLVQRLFQLRCDCEGINTNNPAISSVPNEIGSTLPLT